MQHNLFHNFFSGLRWLDWIFLGGYLPSLSFYLVGINKYISEYIKIKICYNQCFFNQFCVTLCIKLSRIQ